VSTRREAYRYWRIAAPAWCVVAIAFTVAAERGAIRWINAQGVIVVAGAFLLSLRWTIHVLRPILASRSQASKSGSNGERRS
jgi:hypothetical protein